MKSIDDFMERKFMHKSDLPEDGSGVTLTVRKQNANGHLYGHVRPISGSGSTVTRTLDGMWFRDPYISEFTSGVAYIYLMDKQ